MATLLLTKCAAAGLTLAEIGTVASRPLVGMEEEASQLEQICQLARSAVDFEMAGGDTSSVDSDYGSPDGLFCGGQREASLTHLLEKGDKKTSIVMGRRVCSHLPALAWRSESNPLETKYISEPEGLPFRSLDIQFVIHVAAVNLRSI